MLEQVYGREAVSGKCVYEWFKRFREGKETTEDEPRSGRPSTRRAPKMIEKVRQMFAQDRRLTLRLVAEGLGISKDKSNPVVQWLLYSPLNPRFAGSIPAGVIGFFRA